MKSSTKNPTRWTLYRILPFIVVLLSSTFVFGQPNAYEAQTSFAITITSAVGTTSGDITLQNLTNSFSGKIDLYYGNGIQGPLGLLIPNKDGCYVSFSGEDGTTICITSVYSASTETNRNARPRGYDPTRLVGTGTIVIPVGGVVEQGVVYIDVKGTDNWDRNRDMETIFFNGKIGGGGQDFVIAGSFKSAFVFYWN